jgi:hypothetical protein
VFIPAHDQQHDLFIPGGGGAWKPIKISDFLLGLRREARKKLYTFSTLAVFRR